MLLNAALFVLLFPVNVLAAPDSAAGCTADGTDSFASDLAPVFAARMCGPAALSQRSSRNRSSVVVGDVDAQKIALAMIDSAKKSVRLETFLLNGDAGNAIADALIAKRAAGVEVQVLLDPNALGTSGAVSSILNPGGINTAVYDKLVAGGVDVLRYNVQAMPSAAFTVRAEHAKLLLVDGHRALLGGTNFDRDVNHDVDLAIEGPAVDDLMTNFSEGWTSAGGADSVDPFANASDCSPIAHAGAPAPNSAVRILSTGPDRSSKPELLRAINEAQTSVSLEMYGLTDDDVVAALRNAKARGVDVKVVLFDDVDRIFFAPLRGDYDNSGAMMDLADHTSNAIPVKLFEGLTGGQMHTKLMIVDGKTAFLGSTNYTGQEFGGVHNYVAAVEGDAVVGKLTAMFADDWDNHASDDKVTRWIENRHRSNEDRGGGG